MREFFRGRRRKIGVVTLVLACMLAAGLMRTSAVHDMLHTKIANTHYRLLSNDAILRLTRYTTDDPADPLIWQSRPAATGRPTDVVDEAPIRWNWHLCWYGFEFGYGDFRQGSVPVAVASIPYWLAIPLSLLSAWLLLSKPRKPPAVPTGDVVSS